MRMFMNNKFSALRSRIAPWLAVGAAIATVGVVVSQTTTVTLPPEIKLSSEPLYQRGVKAKPTLTLALSVEYPTVGAAHVNPNSKARHYRIFDDSYNPKNDYLGYFDHLGCYQYDTAAQYFTRQSSSGSNHICGSSYYSGNFLNWASASAIDILRLGLTGGNRVFDENRNDSTTVEAASNPKASSYPTVLERAVLPDGEHGVYSPNFFNSENFPSKHLKPEFASGAVPASVANAGTEGIYIANCRNVIFMGTDGLKPAPTADDPNALGDPGGNCDDPGRNGDIGKFMARVAVCDATDAALRDTSNPGYCKKYPNGHFKPVGNLQRHSDQIRVAVFGYLLDKTVEQYGGVLRAPMNYLGVRYFDENYAPLPGDNPQREWDESTGQFMASPRSSGEKFDGAVNYINQFGMRTGFYKRNDPVSELYYESLRYLQGLQPTDQAVGPYLKALARGDAKGIAAAALLKDGFPVYTTWKDPHEASSKLSDYSCVSNNIVSIGDVNTHYDKSVPGNRITDGGDFSRSTSATEPDFVYWTRVITGFEAATAVTYKDGKGVSRSTNSPANPYPNDYGDFSTLSPSDNSSYFMAGMAYWAHTHDIRSTDAFGAKARPGMRVTTYAIDVNEYADQTNLDVHRNNQFFLAAKYGGFEDQSKFVDSTGKQVKEDRGNPFATDPSLASTVPPPQPDDSWQRPDIKGEARNYFLGNDAKSMLAALDNIFNKISADSATIAGAAVSSRRSAEVDAIFEGRFDSNNWHGDVVRYPLKVSAGTNLVSIDQSSPTWHAAAKLDARPFNERKIVVGVKDLAGSTRALNFNWGQVSSTYGAVFKTSPIPGVTAPDSDTIAEQRVEFLRGDRSNEQPAGALRKRVSVMGDVINSGAVFSGSPTLSINDPGYKSFLATYKDRTKVVLVGANDGMLHAFDAQDGKEWFAYIPSWVVPKLNQLTSPSYGHESYVDATPTVAEANLGTESNHNWRTVAVGGTGAGGQGVYALDVTNPTEFGTDHVLWEFTDADADAADLGNVVGRPQVLKFKVDGGYKWFAVVPSGVNNYVADGHASTDGRAALILLDLSKPAGTSWKRGSNFFTIRLPKRTSATTATGVLNLSAAVDARGAVSSLYVGDLHGQLWKLNFAAHSNSSDWADPDSALDKLSGYSSNHAVPLFTTQMTNGVPQPISMAPALSFGPQGNLIVSFGTGKFLEESDKLPIADISANTTSFPSQTVYAIYDNGVASSGDMTINALQRISASASKWDGVNFPWGIPGANSSQRAGWYFDYPASNSLGERQIGNFMVVDDFLVFNSIVPGVDSCSSGSGATYQVSIFNGEGSRIVSTVGLLSDPLVLQGDLKITAEQNDGSGDGGTPNSPVICGTDNCTSLPPITSTRRYLRLSWRNLANYEELKR